MTLDLRPLLYGTESKMPISFSLKPDVPPEFEPMGEATANGEVAKRDGAIYVTLTLSVPYKSQCARCLCEVSDTLNFEYVCKVLEKGSVSEEMLQDSSEEILFPNNGLLSLDESIRDEIYGNFPMRVLCSEECLGLCPVCGQPKRLGCSCKQDTSDPRWDALKNWKAKENS